MPCILFLNMLWVKLVVVHANHSKSTRDLPSKFLLPLLMNIVELPPKASDSDWMYALSNRTKPQAFPLSSENKAGSAPAAFIVSKPTLYIRIQEQPPLGQIKGPSSLVPISSSDQQWMAKARNKGIARM